MQRAPSFEKKKEKIGTRSPNRILLAARVKPRIVTKLRGGKPREKAYSCLARPILYETGKFRRGNGEQNRFPGRFYLRRVDKTDERFPRISPLSREARKNCLRPGANNKANDSLLILEHREKTKKQNQKKKKKRKVVNKGEREVVDRLPKNFVFIGRRCARRVRHDELISRRSSDRTR